MPEHLDLAGPRSGQAVADDPDIRLHEHDNASVGYRVGEALVTVVLAIDQIILQCGNPSMAAGSRVCRPGHSILRSGLLLSLDCDRVVRPRGTERVTARIVEII